MLRGERQAAAGVMLYVIAIWLTAVFLGGRRAKFLRIKNYIPQAIKRRHAYHKKQQNLVIK